MNVNQDKKVKDYGRVMPRVYRSHNNLKATSSVLTHNIPASNVGAKRPSVSNLRPGVFSDLPFVLNDYISDCNNKNLKQSTVVRPKRTLKSLVPGNKPPGTVLRNAKQDGTIGPINACVSAPSVLGGATTGWSDSHLRHCLSSRSHSRLKELKDEIKAYQDTEKFMRLRSRLYKNCGVVLNDVGKVGADKAVQAEEIDANQEDKR